MNLRRLKSTYNELTQIKNWNYLLCQFWVDKRKRLASFCNCHLIFRKLQKRSEAFMWQEIEITHSGAKIILNSHTYQFSLSHFITRYFFWNFYMYCNIKIIFKSKILKTLSNHGLVIIKRSQIGLTLLFYQIEPYKNGASPILPSSLSKDS